ncbi:MAG TPA: cyclase family protein [Jiangellaceae bacterium]|nr:cyclase family protein [Jiangellaceae bacterium]
MCLPHVMEPHAIEKVTSRRAVLGAGLAGTAALAANAAMPGIARAEQWTVPSGRKVVDLTHTAFPTFPNFFGFAMEIEPVYNIAEHGVYANLLHVFEHFGTHWDSPAHFVDGAPTNEQVPAEHLVAPLAVIDISERAAKDPDAVVLPDDILRWERNYDRLPSGSFLAMYSGWEKRLPTDEFLNADENNVFHFPGWSLEAAEFLLEERDFVGLGVDTHGIDPGHDATFPVHIATFSEGKHGLENVANLGDVHPARMTVFVGAPKHQGGSGGPARVLAVG